MPKIAFLFPGQGAQVVGMGRELDRDVPAARALFDRASDVLGFDLRKLCFEGPPESLEFEMGLEVVRCRGRAMQEAALATPSGMASVLGLDEPAVDELCRRVA